MIEHPVPCVPPVTPSRNKRTRRLRPALRGAHGVRGTITMSDVRAPPKAVPRRCPRMPLKMFPEIKNKISL